MTARTRGAIIGVAASVALVAVLGLASALFFGPRTELLDRIGQTRERIADLESRLEEQVPTRRRQRELSATLLAKDQDLAEHRFRTALSAIGERCGLSRIRVNHGQPSAVVNPVVNVRSAPTGLKRQLRSRPDFMVLRGQIEAVGTLEETLNLIALVQAQPWAHRFEGFALRPQKDRESFEIRLDVSTILAPDLLKDNGPDPTIAPAIPGSEALWRSVLAKNVFQAPPADAPPSPPPETIAAAPPPPATEPAPYHDYRLTGVVRSSQGVVAFLLNTRSGERVTLLEGGRVLDAVLVDGRGEKAVFDINGQRFEIFNGNTLAARRPAPGAVHSPGGGF